MGHWANVLSMNNSSRTGSLQLSGGRDISEVKRPSNLIPRVGHAVSFGMFNCCERLKGR